MLADIFTKPLAKPTFERLRKSINVISFDEVANERGGVLKMPINSGKFDCLLEKDEDYESYDVNNVEK